jgi:hypothetical protein
MSNHLSQRRLIVLASGLLLGGLVLSGILMPRTAFTQSTTPQQGVTKATVAKCSVATLQGMYVFAAQGVLIVGKDRVPFAFAGVETYDGHGHVQGISSQSVDGKITRHVRFTGTVTVNPDCTTTETDKDDTGAVSHFDEFIVPDGSRIAGFQTDPGVVLSAVASRGES